MTAELRTVTADELKQAVRDYAEAHFPGVWDVASVKVCRGAGVAPEVLILKRYGPSTPGLFLPSPDDTVR